MSGRIAGGLIGKVKRGANVLSDFPGFVSVLPHLAVILLLWVAAMVIITVVKKTVLKNAKVLDAADKDVKKGINRTAKAAYNISHAVAVIVAVLIVLFLTSPFERNYKDMDKVTPAEVDESFKAPTKAEINRSNEEAVRGEADRKREKATKDNDRALEDATKLFRERGKSVESESKTQTKEDR